MVIDVKQENEKKIIDGMGEKEREKKEQCHDFELN